MDNDEAVTSDVQQARSFRELRETGLLWLINRVVLHPRGFALALHFDDDGNATGWSLVGDGSEPWAFPHELEDELFQKVSELLKPGGTG